MLPKYDFFALLSRKKEKEIPFREWVTPAACNPTAPTGSPSQKQETIDNINKSHNQLCNIHSLLHKSSIKSVNQLIGRSIDQSVNHITHSVGQSVRQSVSHSVSQSVSQSDCQSARQSVSQSVSRTVGRSVHLSIKTNRSTKLKQMALIPHERDASLRFLTITRLMSPRKNYLLSHQSAHCPQFLADSVLHLLLLLYQKIII